MAEVKLSREDLALLADYDNVVIRSRYARSKLDELVLKAERYRLEDVLRQRGLLAQIPA